MLTPQEVQEKKFEKAVFGGYDMVSVDEFLERLTTDYSALYKENTVLKSKLKVLVDTVEEYRAVDEAMRRTLFTAQRMADEMTRDAKTKYEETILRANAEAAESVRRLNAEKELETTRLKLLKEQTESFTRRVMEAYAKQIESIQAMKNQVLPSQTPAHLEAEFQTAREISDSLQSTLIGEQPAERTAKPQQAAPQQAVPAPQATMPMPPPPIPSSTPPPHEPQSDFEITLKGIQDKPFEEDASEEDTSRPRFEFPDLQSQFGQQYSGHGAQI